MSVVQFGEAACEKIRGYLDSYLNNELLVETNHEVLRHLETCPRCTAELNTRARVRTQLQAAVRATPVPPGLQAKIQRSVRSAVPVRHRRPHAGLYILAAAAMLLVGLVLGSRLRDRNDPEQAILRKASGRLAMVLNVGLRDHLHCAVFRKYSKQPETDAQVAVQLGPEYARLAPLVKAHLPADFHILQGHLCRAGDRQYVHFIVDGGGKLLSLIMTRKHAGEALAGGIFQEGVDRYQVVGFESHDYLAYVISDMDAQQNLQMAANLAPAVREFFN